MFGDDDDDELRNQSQKPPKFSVDETERLIEVCSKNKTIVEIFIKLNKNFVRVAAKTADNGGITKTIVNAMVDAIDWCDVDERFFECILIKLLRHKLITTNDTLDVHNNADLFGVGYIINVFSVYAEKMYCAAAAASAQPTNKSRVCKFLKSYIIICLNVKE